MTKGNHSIQQETTLNHDLEAKDHELRSVALTAITLSTFALLLVGGAGFAVWSVVSWVW